MPEEITAAIDTKSRVAIKSQSRFEAIQRRAYELFEQRGCTEGFDLEDWLAAERELGCTSEDGTGGDEQSAADAAAA